MKDHDINLIKEIYNFLWNASDRFYELGDDDYGDHADIIAGTISMVWGKQLYTDLEEVTLEELINNERGQDI